MNIAVLGRGAWGTALAIQAARAHPVRWWGRSATAASAPVESDPDIFDAIRQVATLEESVEDCDWVVVAVPVSAVAEVVSQLHLPASAGVILTCKGLDVKDGRMPLEIAEDALEKPAPCAILSGPSFSDDVIAGRPAAVAMAARTMDAAQQAAGVFHHGTFRVYASTDVVGVQLGGAIKNVLAIASGMAHSLGLGDSARAALITRGVRELDKLGTALGAQKETFFGLSGLGDIALSCASAHSRNFHFGQLLAEGCTLEEAGEKIGQVTEGRYAARAIAALAQTHDLDLPICTQIQRILAGEINPAEAVGALLARPPQSEIQRDVD